MIGMVWGGNAGTVSFFLGRRRICVYVVVLV